MEAYLQIREDIHIRFFLFLHENIYCWYPELGSSNGTTTYVFKEKQEKYQHFSVENKNKKYLIWSYVWKPVFFSYLLGSINKYKISGKTA